MKHLKQCFITLLSAILVATSFGSISNSANAKDRVFKKKKSTTAVYKTDNLNQKYGPETSGAGDNAKVWIAPISGTKYHFLNHSQHFGNAKYKKIVTLKWAKAHGYTQGN